MQLQCFNCITGTARIETTIIPQQWADKVFIKLYANYDNGLHRLFNRIQCFCKDNLSTSEETVKASLRANTTISIHPS